MTLRYKFWGYFNYTCTFNQNAHIITQGNLDLVFALMKMIITHATITHNQNNGFVLHLAHSYTILPPWKRNCPSATLFAFQQQTNALLHIKVIRTTMGQFRPLHKQHTLLEYKVELKEYGNSTLVPFIKINHEQENDGSLTKC